MRILNLGAGVQSTAVFLMSREGLIPPIDHAIFADTQEEPEAVYAHLEWINSLPPPAPKIHIGTAGKLGDHLSRGIDSTGGRFASIPAFTSKDHRKRTDRDPCNEGIIRRQCTKEYKVDVVEKIIRRVVLGLKPKQHFPKDSGIEQLFGISLDEKGRAGRIVKNHAERPWKVSFPLIEMGWTREDCIEYLKSRVPHAVTRSACVFCPFKSSKEWLQTKASPKEWARAVEIDSALRVAGNVVNRNMDQSIYLHRQCIPLEMVDLEKAVTEDEARLAARIAKAKDKAEVDKIKNSRPLFDLIECEGGCGY